MAPPSPEPGHDPSAIDPRTFLGPDGAPIAPSLARQLAEAERFHGHLCGGIVLGVRMARLGLAAVAVADPLGADRKDLLVYMEIDRCATDAITVVTGCRPGKRTMKIHDYGKLAASFLNLRTGQAVRVASRTPPDPGPAGEDLEASVRRLCAQADEALFSVQWVRIEPAPGDLPGRPVSAVACVQCGETILDRRETSVWGLTLCRPCAAGAAYYRAGEQP
jgi:formylmethanofuran dehydrogenase subunit E